MHITQTDDMIFSAAADCHLLSERSPEMSQPEKTTLLQTQASLPVKILTTAGIMFSLILLVFVFQIPNPNMILIAGLILCSALFGYGGGIFAAVIMLGYSLYFFSTAHSFVSFTPENLLKVIVVLIGILTAVILVCTLKAAELNAFGKVDALTKQLNEDNSKLQRISLTDPLTSLRNRLALRQDYPTYQGRPVTVMMMDLNDFKRINDESGHEEGDRILQETGEMLIQTFGSEHCYRYGGDEFLVILPDEEEEAFRKKLESETFRSFSETVNSSIGYVHAVPDSPDRLREMIAEADERMYEQKRGEKNTEINPPHLLETELPRMEFTVSEMKKYMDSLQGKYDLIRVVDPEECRIVELNEDGRISRDESCYNIWSAGQRCLNCSSALACRTGCHQTKAEEFHDQLYYIQSSPVSLHLPDGGSYDAVLELVHIEKEEHLHGNDREAENVGSRAAQYFAHHDGMTDTLNAEAFYDACRRKIIRRPDEKWVMITSNIMNFRFVNTLFGHMKGNEVLVRTASLLKRIAEPADGLCGRLGSDQFAVLIPKDRYEEQSLLNTNQILANAFSSGVYTFCIHFGVYEIDDETAPVSVMCGRANSALRIIREDLSRIVSYYNEEIRNRLLQEQTVISSFEEALNEKQFCMYLQPICDRDGKPIGAEALVRWQKPDGSVIMPGSFIETLENAGLIHKLDLYMWDLAAGQLRSWKNTPLDPLFLSINVSARDFYSLDVLKEFTALVRKYDIDSGKLRLEITETALLTDTVKINEIVTALQKQGFIVEIDDFGTGYSSLSMLKDIRADVLKIDRSFLREIEHNPHSSRLLQAVIGLAENLGMDVITEGVENEQQLNVLLKMGCSHFQGYYFSRPVIIADFESKYTQN